MFGGIGVPELLLIVALVVLLFGAKRIPQIARGLGEGIRNFKGGLKESDRLDDGSDRRKGRDRDDRTS
jgi:sec-independent protein translocase protein TatA